MKTIYATTYQWSPEFQYTSKSVDSGFKSFLEVIQHLGVYYIKRGHRFIIYGDDFNRTIFSDYKFN